MRFRLYTNLDHITGWLTCLLVFLCSCNDVPPHQQINNTAADTLKEQERITDAFRLIDSVTPAIKSGDLVLRTGNDFTSESLRSLNQRDRSYSHCGIASIEHDSVFIYHALGGEWNPDQKLLREHISLFGEPYSNRGIAIYRFDLDSSLIVPLLDTIKKMHRAGIMFDMKFDLDTDDHMYCAEFVSKGYTRGTAGILRFPQSRIGGFRFVGVDDLFLHPRCHPLKRISYK